MWTYDHATGAISQNGLALGTGYSGFEAGKNNPGMQQVHNIGPIPAGEYEIGPAHDTGTHGPHVMALTPKPQTDTLGRDGFLIHGDSIAHPGSASHGCIILSLNIRRKISSSGDYRLRVV